LTILIRFLAGIALLAPSISGIAQISPRQPATDPATLEATETTVLQPISVTGYHIKRIDIVGPAPVVVFNRADLEQAGITTLEEFARELPINFPEPTLLFGKAGAAAFDLRGIGNDATLTLVNGLRIAPYAQSAENYIDVNAIPVSAIERIEILKDGASAVYGADAIAGVVNIILREHYDGIEASAGYGISGEGDGDEILAEVVMGRETSRGSTLFSLSWYDREAQPMANRDWSSDADWSSVGGPNRRNAYGSPPTLTRYDNFRVEHDPACGTDPLVSSVRASPAGGTVCGFNFPQHQDQLPALQRAGASLAGRYEIEAGLSLFGDVLYSDTEGAARQAPQGISGAVSFETLTRNPFVPADHPGNPFGVPGDILSRVLQGGTRVHFNETTAYRAVLGLAGLRGDWDLRLSGLVSNNKVTKTFRNLVFRSRYQQALLGRGGPDENQWYNPFGHEPANDPALIDWLTTDARQRDQAGERSIDLQSSRLLGKLAGGPPGVGVGLQFRQQDLDQWADDNLLSGDLDHSHEPVTADRDIAAGFVELKLPVLEQLEAQLALRYEDYSDFGSTTNPKIALRYVVDDHPVFTPGFRTGQGSRAPAGDVQPSRVTRVAVHQPGLAGEEPTGPAPVVRCAPDTARIRVGRHAVALQGPLRRQQFFAGVRIQRREVQVVGGVGDGRRTSAKECGYEAESRYFAEPLADSGYVLCR
jgi:outer membrane receptor protein involved in Fe transport